MFLFASFYRLFMDPVGSIVFILVGTGLRFIIDRLGTFKIINYVLFAGWILGGILYYSIFHDAYTIGLLSMFPKGGIFYDLPHFCFLVLFGFWITHLIFEFKKFHSLK